MQLILDGVGGQARGFTKQSVRENCRVPEKPILQRDGREKFQLARHRRNQRRQQRSKRQGRSTTTLYRQASRPYNKP